MALVLTRDPGTGLVIGIEPGTDPDAVYLALQRGLRIGVEQVEGHIRLRIEAPECIAVMRDELLEMQP